MEFIDEYNSIEDYLDGPLNDIDDWLDLNNIKITNVNQLEELDNLPTRESRKEYLTRKIGCMYNTNKFDHQGWDYEFKFEKIAKRIIKNNIGKSYDLAFSYYCTKCPKHKQHLFEDFFEEKSYKYRNGVYYGFYIDDNGLIQENKWPSHNNKSNPVTFYSYDYETGYMHKQTKDVISREEYNKNSRYFCYKGVKETDYVEIVTNGYYKHFESRNDPEYKYLMREKQRLLKLNEKRWKKYNRVKELCFLTRDEIQKKKDVELDIIKRDSKGFDSESFKGVEYHGQKRKLIKK